MHSDFDERLDARVRDRENSAGLRAELDSTRAIRSAQTPPSQPATVPEAVAPRSDPAGPTYEQMFGRPAPGTAAAPGVLTAVLLAVAVVLGALALYTVRTAKSLKSA
ncbi:MAG: hypothetical protein M3169_18185 [Candidatus Eremiobacteraeota bacterium]|nr:hypothetical protein [Candidatus Eremiobacteraeota bacterium]